MTQVLGGRARVWLLAWALAVGAGAWAQGTTLTVRSDPTGAKVFVNGYFKGWTDADVEIQSVGVEPRQYTVTLILPGYDKWTRKVSLVQGRGANLAATLQRASGKVICIDPGHPSETSDGTRGPSGVTENHINWVVGMKLAAELGDRGYQVVLTKESENQRVTNRDRAGIANAAGAALMLRLHCDAASASGMSVYYPDQQGARYGVAGPSRGIIQASREVARRFYPAALDTLKGRLRGRGIHGDSATYVGARQGALTGSIFSRVPVLTVEMCVLTNRHDEAFIAGRQGQEIMVQALAAGVDAAVGIE